VIWLFEDKEDDQPRIVASIDGENLGTDAVVAICDHERVIPGKSANYGCRHRNSQGARR
jgi:hypothetical protein